MNRRAAIATLLSAAPAMAEGVKIKWADASELSHEPMLTINREREIGVNLDAIRCLRVTMGGESIDITSAEIMGALRPPTPYNGPGWSERTTITDRPCDAPKVLK